MIGIISQARTDSTRFPEKILKPLGDGTVLEYFYNRIIQCNLIDKVVIATTNEKKDEIIVEILKRNNISFFRGSEENVLNRYYEAAKIFNIGTIVRVTSDCPLIDPKIIDKSIQLFMDNKWDYLYNNASRQLPHGMDVQVFNFKSLELANRRVVEREDLEHVVSYFEKNNEMFVIGEAISDIVYPHYRLTLDYPEDLEVIKKIVEEFSPRIDYTLEEILDFLNKNPEISHINKHFL